MSEELEQQEPQAEPQQQVENLDVETPATDPSPAPEPGSEPEAPSMLEVAQAIVDKSEDEESSDVTPKDTTTPEGEVEPEDEEEDATELDPQDAALPFAKHKRFQELLSKSKERDAFEAKVKEQEPELKQWQYHKEFIQANGITDAEVSTVMNALAMSRTNPARARELLQPIYESLGQLDPNILPADLQEKVKEGDITEEYARRLWKAECANKVAMQSGEHAALSQAQLTQKAIANTISSWESKAKVNNPDFRPSKDPKTPGLFEVTRSFYTAYLAQAIGSGQPNSPMLHQQLLDRSLAEAKALFNGRLAGKPTRKLPTSKSSITTGRRGTKPSSPDDVIAAVAAKHGYNFSRNGEGDDE